MQNTATSEKNIETLLISQDLIDAAEYDEIDQIYDYIRGVGSLPKNLNLNITSELDAGETKTPINQGYQMVESESKQATCKNRKKLGVASVRSLKNGNLHNINENTPFPWIRYSNIEKPIPPSIKTIPSKLKPSSMRRPALTIGKTNISTGHKISSSQQYFQSQQSPFFDIR